jgi:protoheme IX farnesyltransferase
MKMLSTSNTAIGAVAGALPVFIGAAAANSPLTFDAYGIRVLILFFMLYLWQFPHFMAIAWIYKNDYASAGMKMLTTADANGERAGLLAIRTALAMIPMSLVPLFESRHLILISCSLAIGAAYLFYSIRFYKSPNDQSARHLLRCSLIHLPLWMAILLFTPVY